MAKILRNKSGHNLPINEYPKNLLKIIDKDVLFISHNKSDAKLMELIYQLQNFYEKKCLNKMLNIRLRRDFIKKIPKFKIKINGISKS